MIDQKIPREERDKVLLLAEGSHILWVVGWRISEAAKVTKQNKKILEITSNADLSFKVHEIYNLITNTIMAYPAILPIVGGILAAGVGSLIGKKINKATLKRKSLTPKRNNVHAIK